MWRNHGGPSLRRFTQLVGCLCPEPGAETDVKRRKKDGGSQVVEQPANEQALLGCGQREQSIDSLPDLRWDASGVGGRRPMYVHFSEESEQS